MSFSARSTVFCSSIAASIVSAMTDSESTLKSRLDKEMNTGSLRSDVIARGGEFRHRFREYCRNWKKFREPVAFIHVVRHAAEDGRGDDLYQVLVDEEFRVERQALFGINELRSDLHIGREYFSSRSPDLLRYMQITFLEQATSDDPEIVIAHQRNCKGFEEFLQLDQLPEERLNRGLHKTLSRFFPVTYDPRKDPDGWGTGTEEAECVTVRLISYE